MRSRPKLWVVLVVALGIATGLLAYRYLTEIQAASQGDIPMSPQVVARDSIPVGAKITEGMVRVEEVPDEYVHPDALEEPKEAVGKFATTDIAAGEVILASKVSLDQVARELPYKVPDGYRAITVPVNSLTGVGSQVKPGHYADVLAVYTPTDEVADSRVSTILQRALVLAVGLDLTKKDDPQVVDTVTLAVTPNDAQTVALATTIGKVVLTLRPAGDSSTHQLQSIDLNRFTGIYP